MLERWFNRSLKIIGQLYWGFSNPSLPSKATLSMNLSPDFLTGFSKQYQRNILERLDRHWFLRLMHGGHLKAL